MQSTIPIPLHGRPFKLTERIFVYIQAMISSRNFVHSAQDYETVIVEHSSSTRSACEASTKNSAP
jgi:hypothetical protein